MEIARTRSFGQPVTGLTDLAEAATEFASCAAEKLRKQRSVVGPVYAFIRTSPFRQEAQYSRDISRPCVAPAQTPDNWLPRQWLGCTRFTGTAFSQLVRCTSARLWSLCNKPRHYRGSQTRCWSLLVYSYLHAAIPMVASDWHRAKAPNVNCARYPPRRHTKRGH